MRVGFGEIAAAAAEISSGASQVDQQLSDLKDQVTKTLAQWEGSNSGAYQQAQEKWAQAAADLQSVMAAIGTAVQQAGEAYQAAEKKNEGRW
uniref:WXG100 family type VII secretion target n=1 Tax=Lentzea alba TaxID=2714351 RepID=UPI0039BF075E